ncbi:MAG: calcium-translocating P-type ATPase, PMCA-type [Patescibacteria group bacterium]|nr:MAG: calcium-translocating P-type ATPase, PMCA-type [Patescibacteria group bacterium]
MKYKGLSELEVKKNRQKYGVNIVLKEKKRSFFSVFWSNFNNLFNYLLLSAALISFLIHDVFESLLILIVVFGNLLFSIFQELKADSSLEKLNNMLVFKTKIIRNGKFHEELAEDVVVGDIVYIESGDFIPADAVILECINFQVNEASLTGESLPVEKNIGDTVYLGSTVMNGYAYIKVVNVGLNTKFGKMAHNIQLIDKNVSTLGVKVRDLSYKLGVFGVIISILVFVFSYLFKDLDFINSLIYAVSLAVAVVPESFPVILTTILSIGVFNMVKSKSIVRRLASIESLGNMSLLLTDKTGTLTYNKMKVKSVLSPDCEKIISIDKDSFIALTMALCESAKLYQENDKLIQIGDTLELSLLNFLHENKIYQESYLNDWEINEIKPFNSELKRMEVSVKNLSNQKSYWLIKGSLDSVLSVCNYFQRGNSILNLTNSKKVNISKVLDDKMLEGFKILAFAYRDNNKTVLLGFSLLYDPPRVEVKSVIKQAERLGLKTVMVTGDALGTALSIGKQIGLYKKGDLALEKSMIPKKDEELIKILPKVKIFAKVDPLDKKRLVDLYKKLGEVVGVTGDGVNDLAAIKSANVGIAMGKTGTVVVKSAADLIITDDNYSTIIKAVKEGRKIVWNIKRSIKFLVSCNILEVFIILLSLVFFSFQVFTAGQILFINLVTDSLPAFTFAFFTPISKFINKRYKKSYLLSYKDFMDIVSYSIIGLAVFFVSLVSYMTNESFLRSYAFLLIVILQLSVYLFLNANYIEFRNIRNLLWFLLGLLTPLIVQLFAVSKIFSVFFSIKSLDLSILIDSFFSFILFLLVLVLYSKVKSTFKLNKFV